jgi:hypothetical protein
MRIQRLRPNLLTPNRIYNRTTPYLRNRRINDNNISRTPQNSHNNSFK